MSRFTRLSFFVVKCAYKMVQIVWKKTNGTMCSTEHAADNIDENLPKISRHKLIVNLFMYS